MSPDSPNAHLDAKEGIVRVVAMGNEKTSGIEADEKLPSHDNINGAAKVVHADGTVDYVDNKVFGGEVGTLPPGYFSSPQFIGTVVAQCLASICAYLGWVLPANTLSLINADIGPSANITWVATIWTMGSSIGFLLVGRISDLYGRKGTVLSTSLLGLLGCILGATAQGIPQLIASNACNGIAAAAQLSFGIFLGELVPNRQRGPIVTLVFLSSLPFAVFGPVIARSLIIHTAAGWRWSYYMGIIGNGLALVLYHFLYHPPSFAQLHVGKTWWQQTIQLDFVGIFLFIASCTLSLIGLSWAGGAYPWRSVHVLVPLLVGVALFVFFFIYEAYMCPVQPLMPPRMFRNVGFVAIVAVACVGAMIYYSMTVLWPTIISTIFTTDSIKIGLQSSVVGGGILLGQTLSGFAITYVPKVKYQCIFAAVCVAAFVTSLASLDHNHPAEFITLGVFACIAVGYLDNVAFPGVTLLWEPQDIGLATGVLGSIRSLGGAVAQALYVSVFTSKLTSNIPKYVVPAATKAGWPEAKITQLLAGVGNLTIVPGITPAVEQAVDAAVLTASTKAFQLMFFITIPFSAILILAAALVPDFEPYLSGNVAKRLQGHHHMPKVSPKEFGEKSAEQDTAVNTV